jgi:hypothetical protein
MRSSGHAHRKLGRIAASLLSRRDGKIRRHHLVAQRKRLEEPVAHPEYERSHLYVFLNTKQDGPVVLELPAAANGSSFLGTIADAWQVPLTDVGFEGKGGKYLVLPPDYTGEVPTGYIPVRPDYRTNGKCRTSVSRM